MSLLSRIANIFRPARLNRELDEELASHLAEAAAQGRDPAEARRAFGSALAGGKKAAISAIIPWLDSLRADAVFGWRQLMKRKVTSAAAVLSLALAIGACTSAFRIIDALLLRPLPVAHAERLYSVAFQGVGVDSINSVYDSCSYPMFLRMRAAAREQAELIAVSYAGLTDLTYASDQETEKAYLQYVSGWTFTAFGLRPALGRLFTDDDDREPGAHPYAVISDDYWSRRFARDPNIVGRAFRIGDALFQIVGVAEAPFTGTETGTITDIFLPMAMKNPRTLASPNNYWLRTLVQLKPGVDPERVHEILRATFAAMQEEKAQTLTETQRRRDPTFKEKILLEPASAGRSNLQRDYRRSLTALGILVFLALLIACANVANLMTAQAASRAREMALRISIGAGRGRLVQLVLIESAWLAFLATAIGGMFAWWSAPLILRIIDSPENPARLALPADWRVLAFALVLALGITCVFGLAPALRASAMKPAAALRGGEDAHSRHRIMYALVALQIAFCFVVHFVAGLFVVSFDRLSSQPTGFFGATYPQPGNVRASSPAAGPVATGGRSSTRRARCRKSGAHRLAHHERRIRRRSYLRQWRAHERCEFGYSARLPRLVRYHADPHRRWQRSSRKRRNHGCRSRERILRQTVLQRREPRRPMVCDVSRTRRQRALSGSGRGARCALP